MLYKNNNMGDKFMKNISGFLLTFPINFSPNFIFPRNHVYNNIYDIDKIKSIIENYINSKYTCFIKGSIEPFIKSDTFFIEEYYGQLENDIIKILLEWRLSKNIYYKNLKTEIKILYADFQNKYVTVLFKELVSYNIIGHEVTTKEAIQHFITLKKCKGEWKIESDNYYDPIRNMLIKGKNASEIKELFFNKKSKIDISEVKASSRKIASQNSYNRSKAVEYADRYWKNYNPAYINFSKLGGDCTNYVSQCMRAGGAPDDYSGPIEQQWWYNLKTHRYTPSWTGVNQLYRYLIYNPQGGPKGIPIDDPNKIDLGDIIQYNFLDGKG